MSPKKTGHTLSCSLLKYLPQKKSADTACALRAAARGTALRAVNVHTSHQFCQNFYDTALSRSVWFAEAAVHT